MAILDEELLAGRDRPIPRHLAGPDGGRAEPMFRDPGTFWHTVMGQRMLSSRHLIDADPFSFTFGGRPWVPYEWLAEIAMALVMR